MIRRFLVIGQVPELRAEPINRSGIEEYELSLPIEVYWELTEILRLMKFSTMNDMSTSRAWGQIGHLVKAYIAREENRLKFCRTIGRR